MRLFPIHLHFKPLLLRRSGLILIVVLLGACTATQRLDAKDASSIRRVSVSPEILIRASPHYFLADNPAALVINNLFGIIVSGAGLVTGTGLTSMTAFQPVAVEAAILRHNVILKKIIVDEFRGVVADSPRFELVDNRSNEQAQFQLEVVKYGLMKTFGMHMKMRPVIDLRVSLVDSNGRPLWVRQKRVGATTSLLPIHHFDDWQHQSGLLEAGYHTAARAVAQALLKKLN